MYWKRSYKADQVARKIADRHYNRQKPGTPQFVPPGRCLVLLGDLNDALWVTSWQWPQYVKHDWPGAWINSLFRNESDQLSSELIRQAVAVTRWKFKEEPPPDPGMVTFVDSSKVRKKKDPGWCYICAGFKRVGKTKGGLIALQMLPEEMPSEEEPLYLAPLFDGPRC